MRLTITLATLVALTLGVASSAHAVVCETTCNQGQGGSGSSQCYTRCHH